MIEMEHKMKKTIRIIIPVIMVIAILICLGWYLFVYDCSFTRDLLLDGARHFESKGNHKAAAWFYEMAYKQATDNEVVAIELAKHHKKDGNYTQAEAVLSEAIANGGNEELYIALCQTYVEQDKLLDAIALLNNISNPEIKEKLDALRPAAPTASAEPGFYSQYIQVDITADTDHLYVTSNGEYPSIHQPAYSEPILLHDGENVIYAIAVDDNGLVSPLAVLGYTVGGVIEQVTFSDSVIEAEIRSILGVDAEKTLFTNDLWNIHSFQVPEAAEDYSDLANLVFLENLTIHAGRPQQISHLSGLSNLTTLSITDTAVQADEVEIIGNLPKLRTLTLSGCGISDVSGLQNAKNLVYANLNGNSIQEIDAFSGATAIEELYLSNNSITDLAPLTSVGSLKKLDVSHNTLTSLSPVSGLSSLTYLDASYNSLTDLPQLDKLTGLEYFSASNNSLTDASSVVGCTNLKELDLSSNSLTDASCLSSLTTLSRAILSGNQLTELPSWPSDCTLVEIDASDNLITSLDPLSGLQNLNNVYMDRNAEISSVECLSACPVLVTVSVYGTQVTSASGLLDRHVVVNFDAAE